MPEWILCMRAALHCLTYAQKAGHSTGLWPVFLYIPLPLQKWLRTRKIWKFYLKPACVFYFTYKNCFVPAVYFSAAAAFWFHLMHTDVWIIFPGIGIEQVDPILKFISEYSLGPRVGLFIRNRPAACALSIGRLTDTVWSEISPAVFLISTLGTSFFVPNPAREGRNRTFHPLKVKRTARMEHGKLYIGVTIWNVCLRK